MGTLVQAPGEAGWDTGLLIAGVVLAAFGALVGILRFADVLKPTGISDQDLQVSDDVMALLPEARFESFAALRQALEEARDDVGRKRVLASDAAGYAEADEAEAVQAEAAAKALDDLVGDLETAPADKVREAATARAAARDARAAAGTSAAAAAISKHELALAEQTLAAYEALRRGAYGIQIGRTVRERYEAAAGWSVLAVGLVAAGVICLALAPKDEQETVTAQLVSLELTDAGREALGCEAPQADALRVGGDDDTPLVVVLPGGDCPVQAVEFVTDDAEPFGTVTPAEPVQAG